MSSSSLSSSSSPPSSSSASPSERGIPPATFIEDVPAYLVQNAHILTVPSSSTSTPSALSPAEILLKSLQNLYGKYKFMESNLVTQQRALLDKIPEIENALASVTFIRKHSQQKPDTPLEVKFELADSIYASARIALPPANDARNSEGMVALWLGANVMLEYTYTEAFELLTTNSSNARESLKSLERDLAFLKDQITISEVNIARVHNVNVALKQKEREKEKLQNASNASGDGQRQLEALD